MKSLFTVKGKPFFSLGGQLCNSSAYTREDIRRGLDVIELMGMNTIAAPVYWETLEPEEGRYCFEQMDGIIEEARKRGIKAVLLWFGTWKNGASHYVPAWVKRDPARFPVCITPTGKATAILSPLGEETFHKDCAAFCQLMTHLKAVNQDETVISVQVENEPGLLGTARDCSPEGNAAFDAPLPQELEAWLQTLISGPMWEAWQKAGGRTGCSWREAFGYDAADIFSAWHVAGYINRIAAAGKAIYDLPMYVNTWVQEVGTRIAGLDYPSGGSTTLTLDLWKHFAPALDCLCPDLYFDDDLTYDHLCRTYHREDNLLYVPESRADSSNGRHLLSAMQNHGLTGIHCFAVDDLMGPDGQLTKEAADFRDTMLTLSHMRPLIEQYHGTPNMHMVVQYPGRGMDVIDFGDYIGKVDYFNSICDEPYLHLDKDHDENAEKQKMGKGIIVYEGNGSFYLAGVGYKLTLIRKTTPEDMADVVRYQKALTSRNIFYLDASEGSLAEDGTFLPRCRRNGDETDTGLWVAADVGVVHAQVF